MLKIISFQVIRLQGFGFISFYNLFYFLGLNYYKTKIIKAEVNKIIKNKFLDFPVQNNRKMEKKMQHLI